MRIDMNITWYSGEHIAWWAFISIPMFVVWVFGCPLVALYFLFKNRHHLNNTTIQKYFIVLYQGLKDDRFYWEFVNTLRKVLIVWINVFLSNYALFYKGVLAIILIIILIRIQKVLDPYKLKVNNEWELASFNAACITLFGGLLYVSEVTRISFVDIFAFIVILIINVYFILLWVYLFSYSLDRFKYVRKLTEFLKILLRRKDDVVNIDPPQPNSIVTENKRKPIKKLLKKPCKKKEKKRKLKIKVIFRLYNYWLNFSYSIINLLTYLYIYLSYWVWYHSYYLIMLYFFRKKERISMRAMKRFLILHKEY